MIEIVNLLISQSAASELSSQASFGVSQGDMSIDLLEDKNCSEGWMHIKLKPSTLNASPISRTEGVTLYADVKKFNLLKDIKLDYYGDLSGGGFLISTPKNAKRFSSGSGFKLL
nr:AIR synthase [Prochlorococcus marinus]